MRNQNHPAPRLPFAQACFGIAILISILVCIGWAYSVEVLKSFNQSNSSIKVNTAIFLGFLALAGLTEGMRSTKAKLLSRFTAYLALVLVLSSALETIFHFNLGIDELFFKDTRSLSTTWAPGRPSPVTLLSLLLLTSSCCLQNVGGRGFRRVAELCVVFGFVIPFQSLISFLEGVNPHFGLAIYSQMNVITSAVLVLISVGMILKRPEYEVAKILYARTQADEIGRWLLIFAAGIPPTLFFLQAWGAENGIWTPDFGTVVRIVGQTLIFTFLAIKVASTLRDSEEKEQKARNTLNFAIKSRDEFMAIASHELRTPLTSMKLQAEIGDRNLDRLNGNPLPHDQAKKLIAQTMRGLNRMTFLVSEMLDVSRIESGKLELQIHTADIASLLKENLESLHEMFAGVGVTLTINAPSTLLVPMDEGRIEQVIAILSTNVIRYAPHGPLQITVTSDNSKVEVSFKDSGPGIPKEQYDRVFERFERLTSANEVSGLGLGLYLAQKIMLAHGGTISVRNHEVQGAVFRFTLPLA